MKNADLNAIQQPGDLLDNLYASVTTFWQWHHIHKHYQNVYDLIGSDFFALACAS